MTNETMTLGPASGTAWDSTKKMPVPTVEPTPNIVSWKVPILRLRFSEAPAATGASETGRRRSICSFSISRLSGLAQHGGELGDRPVDVLGGDHQRRRKSQRR